MIVYILSTGLYEIMIHGVFSSAEKAMAAYPTSWQPIAENEGCWRNGLDWNEAAYINAYALDELDV